jgi:CarD family transcriptional regulator
MATTPKKPGTSATKRTTARKGSKSTAAKKPAAKKTVAKKPAAKKATAKKPAAKKATAKKPAAKKATAKKTGFDVGDKVVHPQHGAAVIVKKMRQTVAGSRQDYFVLDIATEQLTVFVPVSTIDETIRPVISKNQARKVLAVFKEPPQEAGSNWSRWYKVLNEKMTSGDIYQVAEVVRDLTYAQQIKGISPALKRMLSRARLTLTSELQFALDVDEEEATKRLDRALPKVEEPPAS